MTARSKEEERRAIGGTLRRGLQLGVRRSTPRISIAPVLATLASCLEVILIASDQAKLERPALETIEAMALGPELDGRIVRSHAAPVDRATARCPQCHRRRARPMTPRDACDARLAFRRAAVDEAIAFAFAKTTVLVTTSMRRRMCQCDLVAWTNAIEEYRRSGIAAWRSIGVEP